MERYTQGTVVTANARLSRQMRRDYDGERRRQGLRIWESPDILPRGAWMERVWQECAYGDPLETPVLLSAVQEEALWEQSIAGSGAEADALLDLPATVSAAVQAWGLAHAWEVRCETAEFRGLRDPEAFLDWTHWVERKLRENGWITASQLPRALLDRVTAGTVVPGALFHAGFDEFSPADRHLFDAYHAQAWNGGSTIAQPRQYRVGLRDSADELTQAAVWARRKLEADPEACIGVIVRGLAGLSTATERIFDDVFHGRLDFTQGTTAAFHISAGAPSSEVPLIAEALLILGIKTGLRIGEAGMLLRSPFLGIDMAYASRLYAELRRQGIEEISFDVEAVRRAFPAMAKAADEFRERKLERQHPGEWSAAFSKLLQRAGWPGDRPLNPAEHQAVEHWKNLLSELAALDVVLPRMTYGDALRRLRRIAHDRRFAPRDEGAPVQIMDVLEAAGSQFNALWIAGLHGGVWPEAPRPNPFLPLSLQRSAGMPHSSPERELAYARRVTERLLASATEAVCSYPLFSGEEKLRVSPLIEVLPEVPASDITFDAPLRRIFAAAVPLEVQPVGPAPELAPGAVQSGGMSVLADQAACPFRAFARHRLRTREYDPPDIGISPSERGNVAHKALEYFWRDVKSRRELLARPAQEIDEVIEKSVNAALDSGLSRRHRNTSLERSRALEHDRLRLLLAEWLQVERTRPDFEVVEREGQHKVDVGGLQLDLKVDRIDRMPGGKYVVLDYKTSDKLDVDDWDGDRPDAPQLPLYAVKSERDVEGVFYAKLVPGGTKLLGHAGEALAWRELEWRRVVDQLGSSFLRGDAAVDPKYPGKTCELCDLHSLCRIADVRAGGGAEDEAGE